MSKIILHSYTVDVNVGRSFRAIVNALDEGHAMSVASRFLERSGTTGFFEAPELWSHVEDAMRTPRGRPAKWITPQWGYPWECLKVRTAETQALLDSLFDEDYP